MPRNGYDLPGRKLVSQSDSSIIQRPDVPRSKFTGSWTRKMAFDAAYLVPFMVDEILPGDHMTYDVTAYVRMSTPLFPIFDNQRLDTFFFFVPCRLVWENWTKFMGEQATPASSIAYTIPVNESAAGGYAVGSLYDYLGLPTVGQIDPADDIEVNALPIRAYYLIYREWFRDQNIIDSPSIDVDDGPDAAADYVLQKRAKSHDYFTSALPWPQKFTAPTIGLGATAPVLGIGLFTPYTETSSDVTVREADLTTSIYPHAHVTSSGNLYAKVTAATDAYPDIYADLSQATGFTINAFRQAFMIQSLLERDARGGTRYVELIKSHFGVTSPDFRLQRPEYIGGGQTPLQITPIAQTAPTAGVPLGALGAAGTAAGQHRASYAATEHGYIIGIANIRTELSYQQGIHKMWSRSTRYDFYFPALAQLGEQAILRKEIYATGIDADDAIVFGYQERWHEYRMRYSEVAGIFRSTATGTIDGWHLAQNFASAPTLSQAFIEEDPPMDRVLAAAELAEGQQYLADILIRRTAIRPLPAFGTPALLGRF